MCITRAIMFCGNRPLYILAPPAAQHEEEAAFPPPPSTNRVGVAAVDVGVAAADVGVAAAADVGGAVVHEFFFLRSTCVIDGSVKSIFVFLLE